MKPTNMKHRANGALIDSVAHASQPRVLFQELVSLVLALISDLLPEAAPLPRPMAWVGAQAMERSLVVIWLSLLAHTSSRI